MEVNTTTDDTLKEIAVPRFQSCFVRTMDATTTEHRANDCDTGAKSLRNAFVAAWPLQAQIAISEDVVTTFTWTPETVFTTAPKLKAARRDLWLSAIERNLLEAQQEAEELGLPDVSAEAIQAAREYALDWLYRIEGKSHFRVIATGTLNGGTTVVIADSKSDRRIDVKFDRSGVIESLYISDEKDRVKRLKEDQVNKHQLLLWCLKELKL